MYQTTHFQTREVKTGTEQEILDLDNRLWIDKHLVPVKSHQQPQTFKAYELELDKSSGLYLARQPRIDRFEDVCFIGSNVLSMGVIKDVRDDIVPHSINYDYRYMKTEYGKSL